MLDVEKSFEILENLPLARYLIVKSESDLNNKEIEKIGFPCWIKLSSYEHKLKLGGVRKCSSLSELKQAYSELSKKFPSKGFVVQESVNGTEIIAGIKQDKTFGKILLIGSGGSFAETLKDIEFRVCPAEEKDIEKAIKKLKVYQILIEKKANTKELIKLIKKFSDMDIREADINPIIVDEEGAWIVDARVEV